MRRRSAEDAGGAVEGDWRVMEDMRWGGMFWWTWQEEATTWARMRRAEWWEKWAAEIEIEI